MKWWKRLILTVVSAVWGYVSLDYLYLAFCFLTGRRSLVLANLFQSASAITAAGTDDFSWQKLLCELLGLVMFLLWLGLMFIYTWLIRKLTYKVDITEIDQEGKEHIKRKWGDIFWQYALILTGALARWGYLCVFYFPKQGNL